MKQRYEWLGQEAFNDIIIGKNWVVIWDYESRKEVGFIKPEVADKIVHILNELETTEPLGV